MIEDEGSEVYYSSHGHISTFKDLEETEIDRGNYSEEDFEDWAAKYDILDNDKAIWVTPDKRQAYSYYAAAGDYDKIMNGDFDNKIEKADLVEFSTSDGFIIPESDDGDNGFIFIVKKLRYEY